MKNQLDPDYELKILRLGLGDKSVQPTQCPIVIVL